VAIKRDSAQEAAIIAWIQVIGQVVSSGEGDWSRCFNSSGEGDWSSCFKW
jgi:hypothetical protein